MGRELVWGLLALQQRFVSRAALLAAIEVWHGRPEQPLGRILLEQQAIDPDQAAKVDAAIQDILDRQDSDPVKIFHAVALGEALGGVLEQVPDPEWRSRLRRAAESLGVERSGHEQPDGDQCVRRLGPVVRDRRELPSATARSVGQP